MTVEAVTSMSGRLKYLREKTINATIDTLENMSFMEIIPSSIVTPYDEALDRLRAGILINAPFPGELRLILTKKLAKQVAINAYQTDVIDVPNEKFAPDNLNQFNFPDSMLEDALGEVVNIIAGTLMTTLIAEDQDYNIGIPEIGADAFLELEGASLCVEFFAEGSPFWLVLFGDGFLNSGVIKHE